MLKRIKIQGYKSLLGTILLNLNPLSVLVPPSSFGITSNFVKRPASSL